MNLTAHASETPYVEDLMPLYIEVSALAWRQTLFTEVLIRINLYIPALQWQLPQMTVVI